MTTLALLLIVLLAFFGQAQSILIPGPDAKHEYKSAVAEFSLVDKTRKDPWDGEDRKIMISLFMPIRVSSCSNECKHPYMGAETARIANEQFFGDKNKVVFEKMSYMACCGANQAIDASRIPVVVLEPHTDTSRLLYANLARYMTANNVAVVLMDHPRDSAIVEFPGSTTAFNSGATGLSNFSPLTAWNETVTKAIDIRVQDIKFALDSLKDARILAGKFPNIQFSSGLDTSRYSIVGHGLGGTVATSLSVSDPRVRFSINLSGSAPPLDHNTNAAVYYIGRADYRREHDINWASTWTHLTGPATEFDLNDSDIFDFSDLPIIIELVQKEGGMPNLKGFKVGNSGPWGNHAVKCFVEGIIKNNLHGDHFGVSNCIRIFENRMIPYMAVGAKAVVDVAKESAGVARRTRFGAAIRHGLENWGII